MELERWTDLGVRLTYLQLPSTKSAQKMRAWPLFSLVAAGRLE